MAFFVWMIVVAKGEAARFAQGVAEKELCEYRCYRKDTGGEGCVWERVWGEGGGAEGVSGCLTGMVDCN